MTAKKCIACGEVKALEDFHRRAASKDGRAPLCKPCGCAYRLRYSVEHREEMRERSRQWRKTHAEDYLLKNARYYKAAKDAAYAAYGGYVCTCCGERNPVFLCLDHIDGKGAEHRREIGSTNGSGIYKWLKKNQYPPGLLQVLCFNCNQGKRLNNNVCPHQTNSERKAA